MSKGRSVETCTHSSTAHWPTGVSQPPYRTGHPGSEENPSAQTRSLTNPEVQSHVMFKRPRFKAVSGVSELHESLPPSSLPKGPLKYPLHTKPSRLFNI